MGKSIDPMMGWGAGSDVSAAPSLIVSMSFQLAIPWRVALQQSPPLLYQPGRILHHGRLDVQCFCSERQIVS